MPVSTDTPTMPDTPIEPAAVPMLCLRAQYRGDDGAMLVSVSGAHADETDATPSDWGSTDPDADSVPYVAPSIASERARLMRMVDAWLAHVETLGPPDVHP